MQSLNSEEQEAEKSPQDNSEGEEIDVEVTESAGTTPESGEPSGREEPAEQEPPAPEPPSPEEIIRQQEDKYLRLAAEFDNYKKRNARQFAQVIESANADILKELLTVQDNFERALQVEEDATDLPSFKKGVELIFTQILDVLKKNGAEPFESVGKQFDPNIHEALMTVETDDVEPNSVVEEFSKGYMLNDKVLRHAKVSVAKAKEES